MRDFALDAPPTSHLGAAAPPLENDERHCHNQKFSMVFNVLAFMLKAKALIKQLKEQDYKSMNVSGKVSHMSLCNNKGVRRKCRGLGKAGLLVFFFLLLLIEDSEDQEKSK